MESRFFQPVESWVVGKYPDKNRIAKSGRVSGCMTHTLVHVLSQLDFLLSSVLVFRVQVEVVMERGKAKMSLAVFPFAFSAVWMDQGELHSR